MRIGVFLSLIGLAATLYGSFASGDLDTDRVVAIIAGSGFTIAGGIVVRGGRNELNRAVWWYNAQFAR